MQVDGFRVFGGTTDNSDCQIKFRKPDLSWIVISDFYWMIADPDPQRLISFFRICVQVDDMFES